MENKPRISVIVPIYGVEKYIERCARSLFGQTLNDIEFIFIDDCTLDNSITILKEVVEEYRPFFVNKGWTVRMERMQKNSGLPTVRRHGIQLAKGEYIVHCDSDDWVDAELYETMYKKASEEHHDMVVCNYRKTDGVNERIYAATRTTDKREYMSLLLNAKVTWAVWCRMVHCSVFQNPIIYPTQNMGEDMALTIQLLYFCKKIGFVEKPYYNYYINTSSITLTRDKGKVINIVRQGVENVVLLENFFQDKPANASIKNGMIHLKQVARDHLLPYINENEYYHLWKETFSEINNKIVFMPNISLKEKIRYILAICKIYQFKLH